MNNSRCARRVRLWPGPDELEDRCLLSSATLDHLPRPAVEVHTLKSTQTKHTPKHNAHALEAKHNSKQHVHILKAKHTSKHHAHAAKAHPNPPWIWPPVVVTAPVATATPTPTPTTPTPTPTQTPAPTPTPPPAPQIPVTNQKIVTFAEAAVGQKVGGGECTDLADAAYAAAGAESEYNLGPTGPDADYVWGTLVSTVTTASHSLAGVLPGDVIQFRDVTLVHTTTYPNGSWYTTTQTAEHHTAIVESVSGSTIYVLEQNVGSANTPDSVRQTVQHGSYNLDDLQSGTMWIYQPISLS